MLTSLNLYRGLDAMAAQLQATHQRDWNFLDYAHGVEGVVLYHGSVSDLDSVIRSTWTYEEAGQKVRRDRPITEESFRFLFESLDQFEVFRRYFVGDFQTPINPFTHHVAQFMRRKGDQVARFVILIPAGETDPEFARWLAALDVPTAT
jgi:hypothetical protein